MLITPRKEKEKLKYFTMYSVLIWTFGGLDKGHDIWHFECSEKIIETISFYMKYKILKLDKTNQS